MNTWSLRDLIANAFLTLTLMICTPQFAPDILAALEDITDGI
jgi:hypothetical protein